MRDFTSITKFLKPKKNSNQKNLIPKPIKILNFDVDGNYQVLEILVKNQSNVFLNEITIKIVHVKNFFEKEIMNEEIDSWTPKEKILIISPVIPELNEYIILRLGKKCKEKLFEKRIDCNMINNF